MQGRVSQSRLPTRGPYTGRWVYTTRSPCWGGSHPDGSRSDSNITKDLRQRRDSESLPSHVTPCMVPTVPLTACKQPSFVSLLQPGRRNTDLRKKDPIPGCRSTWHGPFDSTPARAVEKEVVRRLWRDGSTVVRLTSQDYGNKSRKDDPPTPRRNE